MSEGALAGAALALLFAVVWLACGSWGYALVEAICGLVLCWCAAGLRGCS